MATLVLTALGTAIAGPVGGAIGGLVGRQADQAIFGGGRREGPRLKELAVTTSSYGQAVPRQFGRMRIAGTIIWATDLVEAKSSQGGGKGRPSTTTYSYSASFAVALSSTPISAVRRVWADGRLLRGAAGDLKVAGMMRTYRGHGDDPVDPLIAADRGSNAPAFRDFAYVVFENLELSDFGNRIPALTFEVIGEDEAHVRMDRLFPQIDADASDLLLPHARGFADEGGPVANTLAAIDQVYPLSVSLSAGKVCLSARADIPEDAPLLPEELAGSARGGAVERRLHRGEDGEREPVALRYYDEARDYQPGVQRAIGERTDGRETMLDLPATMLAENARRLANAKAHRARWRRERRSWLCAALDPSIRPGSVVRLPEVPGMWLVRDWEWHDRGIELGLERLPPTFDETAPGDPGSSNLAEDLALPATVLDAFELPADGTQSPGSIAIFAAASASTAAWRGAALFVERGESLLEIGSTGSARAMTGMLASDLRPSGCHLIEQGAALEVETSREDGFFPDTDVSGLAAGANRLLVGGEVLQYLRGERTGPTRWKLSGLLRGRGGTEHLAQHRHVAGTRVILLGEALVPLDPARVAPTAGTRLAAIGRGDANPVFAMLGNVGASRRPLAPVHPALLVDAAGTWTFGWTRRARGQWRWDDRVEVPLVEEREEYLVGFGPVEEPHATWPTQVGSIDLSLSVRTDLLGAHGPGPVWVKQVGTYSHSPPLLLGHLS
ncbi:phage tail protein [Erythrobacter sp. HL-111]|uniref:GTA baseplate fiber-binding domain-containing protein n=1 Tax=Erythrobacter sp. HL-111 TaxID=1798193 RepID=UPI0006DA3C80|nr:phage tail protein [Erythrobacter sp. HL-111]KPP94116.1 MAG: putative phage tail protein [Erythrobacteraceae bacterium HL-111]SDS63307.1 Putative phage tail protein [Erythrobacter sp. HL-111]